MVKEYGLAFINNENLFLHVKEVVESKPSGKITLPQLENNKYFHQSILSYFHAVLWFYC